MFNVFHVLILGITQGLTEFIPVSSSGHILIISNLLRVETDAHLLMQSLDFGTIIVLLLFFRKRIHQMISAIIKKHDYRLLRNIIITSLPAGLVGFTFASYIEKASFFTSSLVISLGLIILGTLMVLIKKLPKLTAVDNGDDLSKKRSLIIGLMQVLALIPGVSRSGSTILASRLMGLNSQKAAEYSFLVSIPIMLGLAAKLIIKDGSWLLQNYSSVAIGNIASFIAGLIAVRFLFKYLSTHDLEIFGWYRISLGVIVMFLIASGVTF